MALILEELDNNHQEEDVLVIIGENILLKFLPGKSVLERYVKLKNVIAIPDFPVSASFESVRGLVRSSKELKANLSKYVEDHAASQKRTELKHTKERIAEASVAIGRFEKSIGLSLTSNQTLCFCSSCDAYFGEYGGLSTKCPCGKETEDRDLLNVNFMESQADAYLEGGIWFEDYVEKLLTAAGWKVWCHGKVMGASGVMHPVDVLAIKDGRVLIAECKTGSVSTRDLSHFMIQKEDIRCNFGLFLSLEECSEKSTANLMRGEKGLCLIDNMSNLKDSEIIEKLGDYMNKFN